MTSLKNCSFCLNKGITGPHDHTIRDFTAVGSPIICPELLNINCTYCKNKGHTVNYCGVLKAKKQHREDANSHKKEVTNGLKKRSINIDKDGFVTYKNYDSKPMMDEAICIKKIQKLNVLTSMFAALEVEMDKIGDNEDKNDDIVSWVNIVARGPAFVTTKKRWSDYEDDE